MNEYLISKLREGRIHKGFKQSDVTQYTGIKNTTLSNYENGITEPDIDTFLQLCELYELDYAGILAEAYGLSVQGEDFKIRPSEIEVAKKYRALDPHGQETVNMILDRESARVKSLQEKDFRIKELESAPAAVIELPVRAATDRYLADYFRDASAGGGIFILGNEPADKISVPESAWDERADYVIRVNGDSMLPDYADGDNVMVSSHNMELNYGDVGIFVVDGKVYIKEYGETELISRNPDFPNITIHEFENIVCMGKAIGKLEGEYEIISG